MYGLKNDTFGCTSVTEAPSCANSSIVRLQLATTSWLGTVVLFVVPLWLATIVLCRKPMRTPRSAF